MWKIPISGAILAAILDLRHIGFSEEVEIVKFGFLDLVNLGLDILQALFNDYWADNGKNLDFRRHFGRHLGFPPYWIFLGSRNCKIRIPRPRKPRFRHITSHIY